MIDRSRKTPDNVATTSDSGAPSTPTQASRTPRRRGISVVGSTLR